jgi:hypothetical protein
MVTENPDDEEVVPALKINGGQDALRPYVGKAVAILDGEVRASGTWAEVLDEAERIGILETATFMFVPKYSLAPANVSRPSRP